MNIPFDFQISMFSIIHMIASVSTAGPLFILGVRLLWRGEYVFGSIILAAGIFSFFIVGYIFHKTKERLVMSLKKLNPLYYISN